MSTTAAASPLTEILEELIRYTSIDPRLISSLNDGISVEEIRSKLNKFSLAMPVEAEEMYQWHNGTSLEAELLHSFYFISLEDAISIRKSWTNQEWIKQNLLPIFEFESEYYCVEVCSERQNTSPIWNVYHDCSKVYDSLSLMLFSFLECYRLEAFKPTLKFYRNSNVSYVETIVDEERVAKIKLENNPIRQKDFDDLKRIEGRYYDYP